jgi:2-haloacid dehalogenase
MKPVLLTFDIFGTVIDWQTGLKADMQAAGRPLQPGEFEAVLAAQDHGEAGGFQPYRDITANSLVRVTGLEKTKADRIGQRIGRWPLFPEARDALRRLLRIVPCVAMTNSDRAHGEQAQDQLTFRLTDWLCAEEARVYKPDAAFWHAVRDRRGVPLGPQWWHVSAYADYDLRTAAGLGLTTVFVARPHSRRGPANHEVGDLAGLADLIEALVDGSA